MDIAEVARLSGLSTSALRFYEEKGLISSTGRHGLRRQYGASVIERLALVTLGRKAGFSLDDIAQMLGGGKRLQINRGRLLEKAEQIDVKIKRLTATRELLNHVANCPHESHMECRKFRQLLRVAGKPDAVE